MPFYIPHYSDSTYVKRGEPMPQDMPARQQLLQELGMLVESEVWRANKGWVPRYSLRRKLTQDEMDLWLSFFDRRRTRESGVQFELPNDRDEPWTMSSHSRKSDRS